MKLPTGNLNDFISKYSDLVLAALVVAVLGMIIIPLPTWLLDILLTINITIGILILLVAFVTMPSFFGSSERKTYIFIGAI